MPLTSRLFSGDTRLEACLTQDSAHLTPGTTGDFVGKVQAAIELIDGTRIDDNELNSQTYGQSTADAVLAYKQKRQIINRSYQQTADNIVGKMTIERLDREVATLELTPTISGTDFRPLASRAASPDFSPSLASPVERSKAGSGYRGLSAPVELQRPDQAWRVPGAPYARATCRSRRADRVDAWWPA